MKVVESSAVFQPKQRTEKKEAVTTANQSKTGPTRTCAQSGVKIDHCSRYPEVGEAGIAVARRSPRQSASSLSLTTLCGFLDFKNRADAVYGNLVLCALVGVHRPHSPLENVIAL